jgi:hypothetical protein
MKRLVSFDAALKTFCPPRISQIIRQYEGFRLHPLRRRAIRDCALGRYVELQQLGHPTHTTASILAATPRSRFPRSALHPTAQVRVPQIRAESKPDGRAESVALGDSKSQDRIVFDPAFQPRRVRALKL